MAVKITPTIRRMVTDKDYYEAICLLVVAEEDIKTAKRQIAAIERKPSDLAKSVWEEPYLNKAEKPNYKAYTSEDPYKPIYND